MLPPSRLEFKAGSMVSGLGPRLTTTSLLPVATALLLVASPPAVLPEVLPLGAFPPPQAARLSAITVASTSANIFFMGFSSSYFSHTLWDKTSFVSPGKVCFIQGQFPFLEFLDNILSLYTKKASPFSHLFDFCEFLSFLLCFIRFIVQNILSFFCIYNIFQFLIVYHGQFLNFLYLHRIHLFNPLLVLPLGWSCSPALDGLSRTKKCPPPLCIGASI